MEYRSMACRLVALLLLMALMAVDAQDQAAADPQVMIYKARMRSLLQAPKLDCGRTCWGRCGNNWKNEMCNKMCNVCCDRCNCVPPGTGQDTRPMSTAPPDDDSDRHHYDGRGGTIMADVLSKGRESCYKARDAFYACVEKHADKKPTEIATMGLLYPADCKKPRANFVSSCRPTWVKHFDRQYCAKKRVQRLLDGDEDRRGPISLPQPYTFKQ